MFRSCNAIIMFGTKTLHGILSVNTHKTLDPVCLQFTFHALNAKNTFTHTRTHIHVCVCVRVCTRSITACFIFLYKNFKMSYTKCPWISCALYTGYMTFILLIFPSFIPPACS